jgi:hypothetical protein
MGMGDLASGAELDERHRQFARKLWEAITPSLNQDVNAYLLRNASPELKLLMNSSETNGASSKADVPSAGQVEDHPAKPSAPAAESESVRLLDADFGRLKNPRDNKSNAGPSPASQSGSVGSSPVNQGEVSAKNKDPATRVGRRRPAATNAVAAGKPPPDLGAKGAGNTGSSQVRDKAFLFREAFWAELDSRLRRHAYLEAGQLVEKDVYHPFLEGAMSPAEHLAAGSALHEYYARAALVLLEGDPGLSSAESSQTAKGRILTGLERSDFHLSQAAEAVKGNERKEALAAIQSFHRALIDECQRTAPVITASQIQAEVEEALSVSLGEGDLAADIVKPSEEVRAAINQETEEIDNLAKSIARNSTIIGRLSPMLRHSAESLTRFKAEPTEPVDAFERQVRMMPANLAAAGFASAGQALMPVAKLPQQEHTLYPAVETYHYLLTGGLDEVAVAKSKASKYLETARRGGVLFDQRTFGQRFLKWAIDDATTTWERAEPAIEDHFRPQPTLPERSVK